MTPTLYYYEHCPYCLRVLALIGMANIDVQRHILLNDDEATPIAMVGQKMVPILALDENQYMAESLDIMAYLSEQAQFPLTTDAALEAQVTQLLADNRLAIYGLTMPRWVKQPFAEFATPSAIDYFVKKKTATIGDFDAALANTPALTADLSTGLNGAESLFTKLQAMPSSYAAMMLFAGLYGLRCVEGFAWPAAAHEFMRCLSKSSGLPL